MVLNNPGAVPRQNHIGWLNGARCHCHAHFRHRILHILMRLLLLLLVWHLLQGILSIITADLPRQSKDLCMMAMREGTLLQSRCLTTCMITVRSPKCVTSMLLTVSLSMVCELVRLSMHSAPHTQWLLISFRKPSRLSMHSVLHIRCLLNTLSKPSRLSVQSMLLTSRQDIWALLHLLCRVTQVLCFICSAALTSQTLPSFPVGMLAAKSGPHYTYRELLRAVCS